MIIYAVDQLVDDLTHEEGYRAHSYVCTAGAITVGVGRNIDADAGGLGISEDEAKYMLRNDINRSIIECQKFNWFSDLDTQRQSVLIHLCFWLGYPRLRKFENMLAALAEGDYERAADELLDSKLARDIPARANRLADVLRG